jgi:hypothetical protein
MTEAYTLNAGQGEVRLEFANKDADAVLDYLVDFSVLLDDGAQINTLEVSVEAAGNGESPPSLVVLDAEAIPLPDTGSPALNVQAYFWLSGGTPGVRYAGKIKATGEGSPAPVSVKRFYIVVSK